MVTVIQNILFQINNKTIIKSVSFDQEEIIKWIIQLYCPNGIELDPTYSKGNFYKQIPKPKLRFDIEPLSEDVTKADCTQLPLANNLIATIMFDPPFIASMPKDKPTGIISQRFGYFRNIQHELWHMYHQSLKEFYRILKDDGILIVKSQDTISSTKQYLSHIEIINYAYSIGFYPKDIFVLIAKNRIIGKTHHNQQHARKFHCYFLVFVKQKSPVIYSQGEKS